MKSLRAQVEELLTNWESWYPSLVHAAEDLGVSRARVIDPNSINLHKRHRSIVDQAKAAHREQWGGDEKGS